MASRKTPGAMRRLVTLGGLALLVGLGLSCASIQVSVDYDPDEDFTSYSTFDWLPQLSKQPGDYRFDNPLVEKRVYNAIEEVLTTKGYTKVEDQPADFYVAHFFTVQQKLDIYTVNNRYYGGYGWGISAPETRVREYEEGTLVIDVSDARDKELVWRGIGKGRLRRTSTPAQTTADIDTAVSEILANFPPDTQTK